MLVNDDHMFQLLHCSRSCQRGYIRKCVGGCNSAVGYGRIKRQQMCVYMHACIHVYDNCDEVEEKIYHIVPVSGCYTNLIRLVYLSEA